MSGLCFFLWNYWFLWSPRPMSDRHCHKHHVSCHFSHPNTSFLPYPNISHWLSLHKRRLYSFLSLDCCSHPHLFYGGHNSFQILYPVVRNRKWSTAMAGGIFYVGTRACVRARDRLKGVSRINSPYTLKFHFSIGNHNSHSNQGTRINALVSSNNAGSIQ